MSDDEARIAAQPAQQTLEADVVRLRISELRENPIQGNFDLDHLKAIHAHIFQDIPEHQPGIIRERTEEAWIKHRVLEGQSTGYDVHYANQDIEAKIAETLREFGGADKIEALEPAAAADNLAKLYGDLDHAHGFYEGNSRTLREFTQELAAQAGYQLEWGKTAVGTQERNQLYLARDLAVMERAFPDLTPERAMQTNDRAEYEASFVIEGLRRAVGSKPLEAIIRDGLTRVTEREHEKPQTVDRSTLYAVPLAPAVGIATRLIARGLRGRLKDWPIFSLAACLACR